MTNRKILIAFILSASFFVDFSFSYESVDIDSKGQNVKVRSKHGSFNFGLKGGRSSKGKARIDLPLLDGGKKLGLEVDGGGRYGSKRGSYKVRTPYGSFSFK